MTNHYTVKARISKPWFRKPEIVFEVIEHYQHWHDPSHGNGGGDYQDACKVVGTYYEEQAISVCATLNKYNGAKPE